MQRSSDSIASLAAALAKAQAELVNPEKSLVATVRPDDAAGPQRSFRYASLASGLDIVRKVLGAHEIATLQTTAIDQGAGVVNLTTVLAHSSGGWIASDWPVCPVAETANPQRMGAALTYARRYALFTLVGIAGEDDLDAPDLTAPAAQSKGPERPAAGNGRLNGGRGHSSRSRPYERRAASLSAKPTLEAEASAALCRRLLAELADIASGEEAAAWAQRVLSPKNSLTAADAASVEAAFRDRLAVVLASGNAEATDAIGAVAEPLNGPEPRAKSRGRKRRATAKPVDKSVLALPEPRRIRDRDHVRHVAKQPCLICGRQPSDAHHLRFAQSRALGRKVSDEFTVPLCRGHHREIHRCGDEAAWWQAAGIDPTAAAYALWRQTHPLSVAQDQIGNRGTNYETKPNIVADPHP